MQQRAIRLLQTSRQLQLRAVLRAQTRQYRTRLLAAVQPHIKTLLAKVRELRPSQIRQLRRHNQEIIRSAQSLELKGIPL
jgi:hypothetical protein